MKPQTRIAFFLVALLVTLCNVASGQEMDHAEEPSTTSPETANAIAANDINTGTNSNGILTNLGRLFWPVEDVILIFMDSYLRNVYQQSLPCTVTSWIPHKCTCTPI